MGPVGDFLDYLLFAFYSFDVELKVNWAVGLGVASDGDVDWWGIEVDMPEPHGPDIFQRDYIS